MKKLKNLYKLNSGRVLYPGNGVIGIKEVGDNFAIFEGCNSELMVGDTQYDDLTKAELYELCMYMSAMWRRCATRAKK